jgi:hypothetical protein
MTMAGQGLGAGRGSWGGSSAQSPNAYKFDPVVS